VDKDVGNDKSNVKEADTVANFLTRNKICEAH